MTNIIQNYEKLEQIGEGTYGAVFRARFFILIPGTYQQMKLWQSKKLKSRKTMRAFLKLP